MKAIIFALLLVSAMAVDYDAMFQNWRVQNHKFYSTASEYQKRFAIFQSNAQLVATHNADPTSTYKMALNLFADLTSEEFVALYTMGPNPKAPVEDKTALTFDVPENFVAPDSVDWRSQGYVNPIKDQGQCGSCYSFGANAAMEGAWAMAGNTLQSLSEQNIIDCSWNWGNEGCNGGWHYSAMQYVEDNGGVDSTASYPYTAKSSTSCKYKAANSVATMSSHTKVAATEAALQAAVAEHVVGVAIDASHNSFQLYSSGVYNEKSCTTSLDHAVSVVGYGALNGVDYWLVRNSWGTSWGMSGYIYMSRNKNDQCGIATQAYYATA